MTSTAIADRAPVLQLLDVEKGEIELYVGQGRSVVDHIEMVDTFRDAIVANAERVMAAQQESEETGEGVWVPVLPAEDLLDILKRQAANN